MDYEVEDIKNNPEKISFDRLLYYLCKAQNVRFQELAGAIGYNPKIITRIVYMGHVPKRKAVIAMGVFLGLDVLQIKIFLSLAKYSFALFDDIDSTYIEVIHKTKNMKKGLRISECNALLQEKNIEEKYWFTNPEE